MKRTFIIIMIIAAALMLTCCDNPEAKSGSAVAYGVTAACPIVVEMKVDGDGKVGEVKINEYLSIYDIGRLSDKKSSGVESEDGYAKYVKVGDKTFEYSGGKYCCSALTGTDKSFDALMKTDSGCEWYIHEVKEGNFYIVDGDGNPYNIAFDEYDKHKLDKKDWADKMKNGFHEGEEYDSGWKENIYNLITHIKNHGFYEYTGNEKASGSKNTFKVGNYDTLVDLVNFHDYMKTAKTAYDKAKENVK